MKPKYGVIVDCIDGETTYRYDGPDKLQALSFLCKYDHEGSSTALRIDDEIFDNPEDVYTKLGYYDV